MTNLASDYTTVPPAIRRTAAGFRASTDVPPHGLVRAALNLEQVAALLVHFGGAGAHTAAQLYRNQARDLRGVAAEAPMFAPRLDFILETAEMLEAAAVRLEQTLAANATPALSYPEGEE